VDISITIEQHRSPAWLKAFFDGTRTGLHYFAVGKRIRMVQAGDYLYLVYKNMVVGRLPITKVEYEEKTLPVGVERRPIGARTVVWVQCPGEPAGDRKISRRHQQSFRYDDVPEWAG
jgi:hypothetical protein